MRLVVTHSPGKPRTPVNSCKCLTAQATRGLSNAVGLGPIPALRRSQLAAGRTPLGAEAEVVPRGEHGPCPPRAPPSDDRHGLAVEPFGWAISAVATKRHGRRGLQTRASSASGISGSRWMSHLQLAQLGSKQWSCPRTVLPISVGTIRAVRHLVPRDIVLDAAVRDGEAQPWT